MLTDHLLSPSWGEGLIPGGGEVDERHHLSQLPRKTTSFFSCCGLLRFSLVSTGGPFPKPRLLPFFLLPGKAGTYKHSIWNWQQLPALAMNKAALLLGHPEHGSCLTVLASGSPVK